MTRSNRPGWIYIAGAEGTGLAKIGFAKNPPARLAVLRTDCPTPIELMYLKEGSAADEAELLKRFSALRAHHSWFRFDRGNDLVEFVLESQKDPFHILDIEDCVRPE